MNEILCNTRKIINSFIRNETIDKILKKYGKVEKLPIDYKIYNKLKGIAAYKRKGENVKVKEYLWVLYKDLYK